VLLIGKNGAGKTTAGLALKTLQRIARGTNRLKELIEPKDLTWGRRDVPVRFVLEVELDSRVYEYTLALDLLENFKELRVREEKLSVDGQFVYNRESAQVSLARVNQDDAAQFRIDWHLVALPIVQESSEQDPLSIFKRWLANMLILRPMPALIGGDSNEETLQPNIQVTNFGAWFSGILAFAPSAYSKIDQYLKQVMPDFRDLKNPTVGTDSRSITVQFSNDLGSVSLPLEDLSDGEKCFMICSLVLAANEAYGPLVCFWDEPDNYLALSEVGHFILALRSTFKSGGQLIATSHNEEAIRRFSSENTLVLHRNSHLEPTVVRPLKDFKLNGDVIGALVRGELD
jgi:predicted ATPase